MLFIKKLQNIKKNLALNKKGVSANSGSITLPNKIKLVYFIAAYKNSAQTIDLIKAVYHPDNLYYVNLDKKSSYFFYKKITRAFTSYSNIFFSRFFVTWGKWDQVETLLTALKKALQASSDWTHFINLSGQDFPLKTQTQIQAELQAIPTTSFLAGAYFPPEHKKSEYLFASFLNNHFTKSKFRVDKLFPELKFYKGSQWMILARDFCEYVIFDEFPNRLKLSFKRIYIPDENYFPTLAANWKNSQNIIWNDKRFIRWTEGWSHPHILTTKDLPAILASDAYFARKFCTSIDKEVLNHLRLRIL